MAESHAARAEAYGVVEMMDGVRGDTGEALATAIVRVQCGDRAAFEFIVRRFQDMAVGYAYAVLEDRALAEDVAQEAFITAYHDLGALRDPRAFPGWFRRIVFKQIDRLQCGKRLAAISLEHAGDIGTGWPDPAQVAERHEVHRGVREAIAALPEHQRVVVLLFYISAYSLDDISRFLDIPVATVKMRLHAARRRLKERMLAMINDQLPDERPSKDDAFTNRVMPFIFHPMDEASVQTFLRWRYAPPYDIYNVVPDQVEAAVQFFVDPQNAYYSLMDAQGDLVAFCCFGWDAQVPGGDYRASALDIGMQVRPDLIGQDQRLTLVPSFLDFARRTFSPATLRTTIATFNTVELRTYEQAGFQAVQTFQHPEDGRTFLVLSRGA